MIIPFYLLYVWLSPADWSWLWFLVAITMSVLSLEATALVKEKETEIPYNWDNKERF